MAEEIDRKNLSGPCIVCGKTNYPLSMGGPDICPMCDCGNVVMIFGGMLVDTDMASQLPSNTNTS